jgi:chromosome segregation ATPase
MANMRRNEEMIRQHVVSQDDEIRNSKVKWEQLSAEKTKLSCRVTELESELVMVKNAFKDKADEGQQSVSNMKSLVLAKEKAELDLKSAKDHVRELEETLLAKRKEKDLLMTTYCRVIKDNERLHADLQKLHDDYVNSKAGDLQSETALKAFQTKIQVQNQDLERLRTQLSQSEGKVNEIDSKLQDAQRAKTRVDDEVRDKSREISSLKGVIQSLERSKRDIAAQMSRFGQQANELRGHLRRVEEERDGLQKHLKSSSMDTPASRELQNRLVNLTMELDQTRSQLRHIEREKDAIAQQLKMEKLRASQMEEMMVEEKSKRLEKESIITGLENARGKLKGQLNVLSEEHDKGVSSMRRQMQATRDENERLRREERNFFDHLPRKFTRHVTPSPPDSPVEDEKYHGTEKLKVQNRFLKKHLSDIRNEMKQTLSPGKILSPDLESSIIALTSEDADESTSPTSDEIVSSNAEIRRRLEHENRLLFKIVDKVKSELLRAGLDTPMSISSSNS